VRLALYFNPQALKSKPQRSMSMSNFKVGAHDKGFWDIENKVNADKNPIASGLTTDQAIAKAKQHAGAELVIVKSDGQASVHSLSMEDGYKEGKKVLISELDRDPAKKVNTDKTPLAIDNNIAYAFSGQGAFLVDEKDNTTFLGDVVDQESNNAKIQDADKFASNPTAGRVNAAYAIARDGGDERHIDKTVAKAALDQLQQNYRNSDKPAQDIALLKDGDVKARMQGLIGDLKNIAGQEQQRVTELKGQLQSRTETYQTDIKDPNQKLNAANGAWAQANDKETANVNKTAHNLREARMPNIFNLEDALDDAKGNSEHARQNMEGAIQNRVQAEGHVNDLERLPAEAESHRNEARRLQSENNGLHGQIQMYVTATMSSVESELRDVNRNLQRNDSMLGQERARPTEPVNTNNNPTTNPFNGTSSTGSTGSNNPSTNPFNNGSGGGTKPTSGNNPSTNPFNNGNSGGGNNPSTNPFNNGSAGSGPTPPSGGWRNESRISDLERTGRQLRSDRDDLKSRDNSLNAVNSRLMYTQDIDQISLMFMDLSSVDRTALSVYKDRKDANVRAINDNNRAANQAENTYQNEIGGARRNLASASSNEESARSAFGQAENRVGQLTSQVQDLTNNPRPDTHPEVKPAATAYQKAVEHKEATVGANAPLTTTQQKAQSTVDSINGSYANDKRDLEGKISNVQQTLLNDAQGKISQTRNQVK